MEPILLFWEKLQGVLTSQRFVTSVVGIVALAIVLFNIIAPLFGWNTLVEIDEETAVAGLNALVGQLVITIGFVLTVLTQLFGLVRSFTERPPKLRDETIVTIKE